MFHYFILVFFVFSDVEFKRRLLRLLREDEEFRFAVAGLIGLDEILRRLDRHEAELVRLRKDMVEGFRRHDESLKKHWEAIEALRRDMVEGFKRHWEAIEALRRDMVEGFKRHDELLEKHWEILMKHDESILKLWEAIEALRRDMTKGFDLINRRLDALGARWGLMSEEAFRKGLRGLLEREFGFKVEKWSRYDKDGIVFGFPSIVEVDVAVHDEKVILIEISSHVRRQDVYYFLKKADFYSKVTGRRPDRLLIVSPYVDENALKVALEHGVEVYTGV